MVDWDDHNLLAVVAAAAVAIIAGSAELLHAGRVRRIAVLAFGPRRRPLFWARLAPFLRTAALTAVTWGLVTLYFLPPQSHRAGEIKPHEIRRLLLVLDVSPSMKLADAGPQGKQRRDQRAADILKSFFDRVQKDRYRTTIVAVYSDAKPVVRDTSDLEVVRNILTDLPLAQAFKAGPTNLFAGVQEAVKLARPWPPGSTLLMIVSDGGDPVPGAKFPKLPASIGHVVVVGVGSPTVGKFIDGVLSRQDVPSLRQAAARLLGTYHNGNEKHLPTDLVKEVSQPPGSALEEPWTRREYALLAVGAGSFVFAGLPTLLQLFGTLWRPGRRTLVVSGSISVSSVIPSPGESNGRSARPMVPSRIVSPHSQRR
jgi:Ca-activated chloride channel family protein